MSNNLPALPIPPDIIVPVDGKPEAGPTLRALVEKLVDERVRIHYSEVEQNAKAVAEKEVSDCLSMLATKSEVIVLTKFEEHWRRKVGNRVSMLSFVVAFLGLGGLAGVATFFWNAMDGKIGEKTFLYVERKWAPEIDPRFEKINTKVETLKQEVNTKLDAAAKSNADAAIIHLKQQLNASRSELDRILKDARDAAQSLPGDITVIREQMTAMLKKLGPQANTLLSAEFQKAQLQKLKLELEKSLA